jgi:hypothetical protein
MQELVADQLAEIGASPSRVSQKRMNARQRLDAAEESSSKFIRLLGTAHRLLRDGLHARKSVLDAVIKL